MLALMTALVAALIVGLVIALRANATLTTSVTIGGVSISGSMTRTGAEGVGIDPTLQAAQAGTLTTRTDTDTGVVSVVDSTGTATAPTVAVSDKISLVWTESGVNKGRHGMTVTAITATTVSIDGGSGDVLPVLNSTVTLAKETTVDVNLAGSLFLVIAISCPSRMYVDIQEASGTTPSVSAFTLAAGESYEWRSDGQVTNPFATTNIGSMIFANLDTTASAQVAAGILYDGEL